LTRQCIMTMNTQYSPTPTSNEAVHHNTKLLIHNISLVQMFIGIVRCLSSW